MKTLIRVCAALLVLAATGCGATDATEKTPSEYLSEHGGVLAVYESILKLTDCVELQAEFDQASENNKRETPGTALFKATLGYMVASDERMQSLGCYSN